MKKYLTLAASIATVFFSNHTTAEPLTWTITSDTLLDGTLTNPTESHLVGRIFTKQFYLEDSIDPAGSFTTGGIESDSADIGAGTQARIHFTTYSNSNSTEYSGHSIGNGQYQGVWYNGIGDSGDFLLDTNAIQHTPFDPSTATVTPSTQYAQHPATAIFDGVLGDNNSNVWIGVPDDPGASLTIQLTEARTFINYSLSRGYCKADGYLAGTWTLSGSNDGVNYNQIDNVSVDQGSIMSCSNLTKYTIDTPSSYIFYKFEFEPSSVSIVPYTGVAIGELVFEE